MATLSKRQKKYIDQAIRRAEQQFNKWTKYEREYAKALGAEPPKLKLPTRGEAYEKIDITKADWAKQIKEMATIEVYQPPTAKRFEERTGLTSTGGIKSFSYNRGIQLIKTAYRTHEKNIAEKAEKPVYSSLRNLYKDVEGRTEKRWGETISEQKKRQDAQYLKNLAQMLRAKLEPVSPELYQLMLEKMGVKEEGSEGKSSDFKVTSRIATRAKLIDRIGEEGDKAVESGSIARAISKQLAGKAVSGLSEIINYDEIGEILTSLMKALGISTSRTYDGMTVEQIIDVLNITSLGEY